VRRYLFCSSAILVPCFWLPRIEAGDLSSHVYNAWLAQLIAHGQAPGLRIQPQWTNSLFDLLLSALWGLGAAAAQKIAVAEAVLLFFWGAFRFVRVAARREPWFVAPILAALSYGWVFHAGFFNFYLSLGLSFHALVWLWRRRPGLGNAPVAVALLAAGYTAHALPVAWVGGMLAYRMAACAVRPRHRAALAIGAVFALAIARRLLASRFNTTWYPQQVGSVTGADQIAVYGLKFEVLSVMLLGICGLLLVQVLRQRGWRRLLLSPALHAAFVTAAIVAILPSQILLPGYAHALGYIAERMSLAVAVCACAVAATARVRRTGVASICAVAAAFFLCLYVDQRAVNRIEERLELALTLLPPGARVVSSLAEPRFRVDPLVHLIDRACIGRCFSYANYEPATEQFRIRAEPGNPVVVTRYIDSYALQTGTYKVKPSDLPLWGVFPSGDREGFVVRPLAAAESWQMAGIMETLR
jgi:hypothetical protein